MPPHVVCEAETRFHHLSCAICLDQPFCKRARQQGLPVLTGGDETDDADFIGPKVRTARLMIADSPARIALQRLQQPGETGKGIAPVLGAELACKLIPDEIPLVSSVLLKA
ncbi:hypothetical protein [Pelagibius sp. Alg239-R121]|uniref:hypothetical protein n=1 Tax=Pelagibius sp. Alg239-R121 TaxID=2993448 RepID=UPI0024A742FB|nr:hypothetical protein [Pelagibius sp. Alg239-R121]